MSILLLAAASLILAPEPEDSAAASAIQRAYPTQAVRRGKSGAVQIRVMIDPHGKTYRCDVLQNFGDQIFAREVCKPVSKTKFAAPKAPDGSSSHGMITTLVRYSLMDRAGRAIQAMRLIPDVALGLEPDDLPAPTDDFKVVVQVRPDGSVSHCEGLGEVQAEWADRACAEAKRLGRPVGTNQSNEPVSYVAALRVRVDAAASS